APPRGRHPHQHRLPAHAAAGDASGCGRCGHRAGGGGVPRIFRARLTHAFASPAGGRGCPEGWRGASGSWICRPRKYASKNHPSSTCKRVHARQAGLRGRSGGGRARQARTEQTDTGPATPFASIPRMHSTPVDILQSVFGYSSFRGQQQAIVEHVAEGGDALVLMPTGGGKSLCYQIPALLRQGTGIVVSPLIALMQDQVDALRAAGVAAAYLNSSLDAASQREVERQLLAGELNLLYVAPERLLTGRFLGLLEQVEVALFAIDEAHCVSQWGHDFRPEYRELTVLHGRFPQVPRIALTATADPRTREEIVERLALGDARQFVSSFDRPNIGYRVMLKHNPRTQLMQFLDGHRGEAGNVYALSRKKVDDTAAWLAEAGI